MWPSQLCRNTSRDRRNRKVISDLQVFQLSLALAAYRRTGEGVTPSPDIPLQRKTLVSPHLPSFMPGSQGHFHFAEARKCQCDITLHRMEHKWQSKMYRNTRNDEWNIPDVGKPIFGSNLNENSTTAWIRKELQHIHMWKDMRTIYRS